MPKSCETSHSIHPPLPAPWSSAPCPSTMFSTSPALVPEPISTKQKRCMFPMNTRCCHIWLWPWLSALPGCENVDGGVAEAETGAEVGALGPWGVRTERPRESTANPSFCN